MAAAVRRVIAARGVERIVWIGYSGGGVLAVFWRRAFRRRSASSRSRPTCDIDAWTDVSRHAAADRAH